MFKKLYLSYVQLNHPDDRVQESDIDLRFLHDLGLRYITRILLISYALLIFRPALPFAADMLAHTFWKEAHLKTVHTVNGKTHVHYELVKIAQGNEKEKSAEAKVKSDIKDAVMITPAFLIKAAAPLPALQHYTCFQSYYLSGYTHPDLLPPKA